MDDKKILKKLNQNRGKSKNKWLYTVMKNRYLILVWIVLSIVLSASYAYIIPTPAVLIISLNAFKITTMLLAVYIGVSVVKG
jgi:hypothetical protein